MTAAGEGVVVLGAGLAGLAAAEAAGPHARVFEAQNRPGGECATDRVGGFDFDRAGHLLHVRSTALQRKFMDLLPGEWRRHERRATIRVGDAEVRYPIQANLYGLPPELKARCLQAFLAAQVERVPAPRDFAAWVRATFGTELAKVFFEPYNRKLWTVPPEHLTLAWMGAYVPRPDVARVVEGAFHDIPQGGGYNARFWYPRQGGIGRLAEAWAARLPGLRLGHRAVRVDPRRRSVDIAGRGRLPYRRLISTLPLPALVGLLEQAPRRIREAATALRATSMLVVNLGIRRASAHVAHWVYVPDPGVRVHRVGFPANYGKVAPPGCSILAAEVSLPPGGAAPSRGFWSRRVRQELRQLGWLRPDDDILVEHQQVIPHAYVIFDRNREGARRRILAYLEQVGIRSIGRWGAWEYSAMEDAVLEGWAAGRETRQAG